MKAFKPSEGQTPFDASGLIPLNIRNYQDLNAAESRNILAASRKYLRRRKNIKRPWITERFIRMLHHDMFSDVWEWAGTYRETEFHMGVRPFMIREEMGKLCQDAAAWQNASKGSIPVLECAVRLHHRVTWIHPFPNGNGRLSRLLLEIYLNAHHHPRPMWPTDGGKTRQSYLDALRQADTGNFTPLIAWIQQFQSDSGGPPKP